MKQHLLKVALAMVCGPFAAFSISAASFESGGLTYTVIPNTSNVKVAKGSSSDAQIVVPDTVTNEGTTYTVTEIAKDGFRDIKWLKSFTMPNTVTTIGKEAFASAENMETLVLSTNLTTLGSGMCDGCYYLRGPLVMPEGVKSIPSFAFYNCMELTGITFSEQTTSIGNYAFCGCYNLTELNIPASVTSIGTGAFTQCKGIEAFNVDPNNTKYASVDGVLYNKEITELMQCPAGQTSLNIPETTTKLWDYACCGCSKLESVVVPNSVTDLGQWAFKDCTALKSIVLPQNITTLGNGSLMTCSSLTSVAVPESVKVVGDYVFQGCVSLNNVAFGQNVTSIGAICFERCVSLNVVNISATTPPTCAANAFIDNVFENASLVVPASSVDAYKNASPWSNFKTIVGATDKANSLILQPVENVIRLKAQPEVFIPLKVTNDGNNVISSLTYTLVIDGNSANGSLDAILVLPNGSARIEIPVQLQPGEHACSITITGVNGTDNTSDANKTSFTLQLIDKVNLPENAPMFSYGDFESMGSLGHSKLQYSSYKGAMCFKDDAFVGWKVLGITVKGLETTGFKNFQVWNSSYLGSIDGEIVDCEPTSGEITGAFFNPVTIDQDGFYFGFSMDRDSQDGTNWPIPYTSPEDATPTCLFGQLGDESWTNWSSYGALPAILYLEGPAGENSVHLIGFTNKPVSFKDTETPISLTVANMGGNTVNNIEVAYTVDGTEFTSPVTLDEPLTNFIGQKKEIYVPIAALETPGSFDMTLSISKVNGQPNAYTQEPLTATLTVGEFATIHTPVMEEYTGTGCGWCPRGTLAMSQMAKTVPGFIGAAYHRYNPSDPMYLSEPQPFEVDGAPSALLDRTGKVLDPFTGSSSRPMGILDNYDKASKVAAPANIKMATVWNDDSTAIQASTTVKFSYAMVNETYKLGYILTIDSLSHPNSPAWKQDNYYAGGSEEDPLLESLCNNTFDLTVYNHVVIDQEAAKGVKRWRGSEITPGNEYEYNMVFSGKTSLADQETIEPADIKHIHVVALLLDADNHILNAAKVLAGQSTDYPVGIEQVVKTEQKDSPLYYDLTGRRVARPASGIFIKVQGSKASKILIND